MMVHTYMDFFVCFNVLLFLSTSKGQTYDKILNKQRWEDDNDSMDARMTEWGIGYEENLVQIPEHKTGKSALFSVAATGKKKELVKGQQLKEFHIDSFLKYRFEKKTNKKHITLATLRKA